jgi:hypothetical protein
MRFFSDVAGRPLVCFSSSLPWETGDAGKPVFGYWSLEIKKAIVGYGRAGKARQQCTVDRINELPELPSLPCWGIRVALPNYP